jgi:dihydrofolate synthase/folylpolyglutamate synthase
MGNRNRTTSGSEVPPDSAERLLERLEAEGIRLGLDSTRLLLDALGRPQDRYPVVLVAGTNGKGTTAALLTAMAVAAGYRTGLYTSPHLESVEERIRIDGEAIEPADLARCLRETVEAAERDGGALPTYFEAMTVTALRWFAEREVELAVVEVGLGGRLDATNVTEPVLSLITDIDLDHHEYLGSSLTEIAIEKAGILRRERPAIAWLSAEEAEEAVTVRAEEIGARLELARRQTSHETRSVPGSGQHVELRTPRREHRLRLGLLGAHQAGNLALAVLAAEKLAAVGWDRVTAEAIAAGCAACRWPGRIEPVALPGRREALLDVAHNPAGVAALVRYLEERGRPWDLLFGVLGEKSVEAMLPPLAAGPERVTLTAPASDRAVDPGKLVRLPGLHEAEVEPDPGAALERALETAADRTLVVSGSTYLVGDVRRRLRERYGEPPPAVAGILGEPLA